MTFRERYLAGETDFEEIFDLTDEWNMSDETCTLREYLGLTAEEEDVWISVSDDALEELMEKERKRKIFFTDLDDTLLNSEKEITPKTREAMKKALQQGNFISIATGRAFPSAMHLAKRLRMEQPGCYIISYNGGQIYDLGEKKMLRSILVPAEVVKTCFECAEEFGIHLQTYSQADVLVTKESPEVHAYCAVQKIQYQVDEHVWELVPEGAPKLLAISKDPEKVLAFKELLESKLGDQLDLFRSSSDYLEIVPKGINKGDAVRFLCQHLGVPIANSVSAGDQENDLQLIEAAGVGCAMVNGVDALKARADYITTGDMNHDGVAEILEKFVLE